MVRVAPAAGSMTYGHVALARGLVEVLELLARRRGVGLQVEVGAVGDALELVPAPGEEELDVGRGRRVVRQLVGIVVAQPQLVVRGCRGPGTSATARRASTRTTVGLVGRDEVLHLHLLELAGPEDEVLRGDLVAERLTHLGDAERWLLAGRRAAR